MAQREKELHAPETITLCSNNCGFPGNPATNNMCQSCFKTLSEASAAQKSTSVQPQSRSPRATAPVCSSTDVSDNKMLSDTSVVREEKVVEVGPATKRVNRCFGCGKRVGLTGFSCRCGQLFCGVHRYSDRHDCTFDYKAAGREAIALQNPTVRAAKIVRI